MISRENEIKFFDPILIVKWNEVRENVQMITQDRLNFPEMYEEYQGNYSMSQLEK